MFRRMMAGDWPVIGPKIARSPQFLAMAFVQAFAATALGTAVINVIGYIGFAQLALGIGYAVTIGLSLGARALFGPKAPRPEDVQTNFRQATPVRAALYGWGKLGGPWVFGENKSGDFHRIVALASRELSSIEQIWIDDNLVTLDGSGGVIEDPYAGAVVIKTRLGEAVETSYSELTAVFPEWTTDHRGDGIASLYAKFGAVKSNKISETYPSGINTQTRVVAKGCAIFDPRDVGQFADDDATWAWSDNAAPIIMDYLWSRDGFRLPMAVMTTPQALEGWQQAADDCDDAIDKKGGGTEARYRIWNSYNYAERPADVLSRFMAACDAVLRPTPDGGVTISVGVDREPTVTLDETMVLSFSGVQRGKSVLETANVITSQFTSADHDWQATDADPWIDDADVAERGEITKPADFICSPSHGQTRRLMKIAAYDANPEWRGVFIFNLAALQAFGERAINFNYAPFGITGRFKVQDFQLLFGENSTPRAVQIALQSMPGAAFSWDAETEEGTTPAIDSTDGSTAIPDITGFDAVIVRKTVGTALVPFADLSWDTPPSVALNVELQGKLVAGSVWQSIPVNPDENSAESFVLSDGDAYEFQARHITLSGRAGDWTTPSLEITAIADPTAPGVVTAVSGTGGAAQAALAWTSPNSANYAAANIRRNTVNTEGGATLVQTEFGPPSTADAWTDTALAAGTYYYWIKARNASGVESASVATGAVVVT